MDPSLSSGEREPRKGEGAEEQTPAPDRRSSPSPSPSHMDPVALPARFLISIACQKIADGPRISIPATLAFSTANYPVTQNV